MISMCGLNQNRVAASTPSSDIEDTPYVKEAPAASAPIKRALWTFILRRDSLSTQRDVTKYVIP
jgi:hypothetical protein